MINGNSRLLCDSFCHLSTRDLDLHFTKLSQIADLDRTFSRNIGVWLIKKKTMKVSNSTRDNFSPDWYYKREKWTGQHHRALGIISRPRNCKWVTGEEKWIHHETQKAEFGYRLKVKFSFSVTNLDKRTKNTKSTRFPLPCMIQHTAVFNFSLQGYNSTFQHRNTDWAHYSFPKPQEGAFHGAYSEPAEVSYAEQPTGIHKSRSISPPKNCEWDPSPSLVLVQSNGLRTKLNQVRKNQTSIQVQLMIWETSN